MKFVDSHAHLVHNPQGLDSVVESGAFSEIWLMDLSPVQRLGDIELATEAELFEVQRRYPGFFRLFGFLDLDNATPEDVRRQRDKGFVGLKPYKQLKPYGDYSYFPLYAEAEKLGMPILFHTGLIAHASRYDGTIRHSFGPENMRPTHLAGIAEAFPDLQIIQGHMGWPYMEETEQNLYYYKNITGDQSGYLNEIKRFTETLDRRAHDGTDRYFSDKMHFATDEFYGCPASNERALKLKTFWELYFGLVGSIYYRWGRPEEQEKFFVKNAKAIFGE